MTEQELLTQKQTLEADQKTFADGVAQRVAQVEHLNREIEQYRGAASYCGLMLKRVEDQLAKLTTASPTPPTCQG